MPTTPPAHRRCPDCGGLLPEGCSPLLCPACALEAREEPNSLDENHLENTLPRLGNCALLREIGRGGMGVVYEARQESLGRLVAVKVLPGSAFATPGHRERFQREARAVARLRHPGIVAIHEVGEHRGQPYLVMDLLPGGSLAERLAREGHLPPGTAATLLADVARAVAHAHGEGVIHRDLKPSNLLFNAAGQAVLADFGLARFTGDPAATQTQPTFALGSPSYLPPERAGETASPEASPAEDIYGLGAVLYHCLTGRPPFTADSITALLAATREAEPVPPSRLNASVPKDLETVCLRCLEKLPSARYGTACEVADELGRFLAGEPVRARPVGALTRLFRRARRHPLQAALVAALALSLAAGTTASVLGWRAALRGETQAREEAERRRVEFYSGNISAAASALLTMGDPALARSWLEAARPRGSESDLRGVEWRLLHHLLTPQELVSVRAHDHIVTTLAWNPDGQRLLSGSHDGSVKLWNWTDGPSPRLEAVQTIVPPGRERVQQLQWLPLGNAFLSAEELGKLRLRVPSRLGIPWEIPGTQFSLAPEAGLLAVSTASPFYYETGGELTLWRFDAKASIVSEAGINRPVLLETVSREARAVALSPDGNFLAWTDARRPQHDAERGVWLKDRRRPSSPPKRLETSGPVWALAFSPDSRELAVTRFHGGPAVLRFATANGSALPPLAGHSMRVWSLAYAGSELITTSSDRSVRSWQVTQPEALAGSSLPFAHADEIWSSAIHPSGNFLATADKSGVLKVFPRPLPRAPLEAAPSFPHYRYTRPEFAPDSRHLLTLQHGKKPGVWRQPLDGSSVVVETEGRSAGFAGLDFAGRSWFWSEKERTLTRLGEPALKFPMPTPAGVTGFPWQVGHLGGGDHFFVIEANGDAQILGLGDGKVRRVPGFLMPEAGGDSPIVGFALAISPNGNCIAAASWHELVLHDFTTGETRRFPNNRHWARDLAFSPDGKLLASAGIDGRIVLRDLPGGGERAVLAGHMEEASGVAFSPDGRTLVSVEIGLGLRFWRLDTLREVLYLPLPDAAEMIAFSPDGSFLAVVTCPPNEPPEAARVRVLRCD